MRTILVTAYAVNPYKGSEEGTGWNLTAQIALNNKVVAVTRKNNRGDIEKFMQANSLLIPHVENITFLYFDLPKWAIAWKKGPLLSALYFYMWQFFVALWLMGKKVDFDIAHSLNFHSNWTPSFLWMLGKPFVWGPVGNHTKIPKQYIKNIYGTKAFLKDRMLWYVKCWFWNVDPFVYICKTKAQKIFCVNTEAIKRLNIPVDKAVMLPAVASEQVEGMATSVDGKFTVLSVGRFVPLKGFDLAIKAFGLFYNNLREDQKADANFLIIGTGPEKQRLQNMIADMGLTQVITIKEWMPRNEVIERFGSSSAYLFPSHEGAGMVVAEALSYGIPVVCLDNYGPGEYVHLQSKLKVTQGSYNETASELAMRLFRLYSYTAFYQTEQRLAKARYNELFQWKCKGEVFNAVYNAVEGENAHTNQSVNTIQTA